MIPPHRIAVPLALALAVLLSRPELAAQGQTRFTDVTTQTGVNFVHTDLSDTMAGGICFFDYDNDGYPDLFATARGESINRLYHNDQNGTFTDVSVAAGVGGKVRAMGAFAADLDADGWQDLLVVTSGRNLLFKNNGDGTFTDVSVSSGLQSVAPRWSTAATFGDYDRDGDLDFYIGNYVYDGFFPHFDGGPNRLFRNDGGMQFTEVGAAARVDGVETFFDPRGYFRTTHSTTLSTLFCDYDFDGWPDILVGNDFGPFIIPNQLFANNRDGTFTEVGASSGFRIAEFNMGLAIADVNGDQVPDIYTTNLGDNHLLFNDGLGRYHDVAGAWGAKEGTSNGLLLTSWACMFLDADLDTRPDLYVSNGHIQTVPAMANDPNAPSHLLYNLGQSFMVTPEPLFPWDRKVGRGAARADIDLDGDEDIVQLNNKTELKIYRNDCVTSNSFATLELRGTLCNRDAIGARVQLRTINSVQVFENTRGGSYVSSNGAAIVAGLGRDTEVHELSVTWPSGVVSRRYGLAGNRRHEVVEPTVTVEGLGTMVPLGTEYVILPVHLRNHATTAEAVTFSSVLSIGTLRSGFPIYSFPTTLGAGAQATVSVFLPIPSAAIPLARRLGVWLNVGVHSPSGGIDEIEQPIR